MDCSQKASLNLSDFVVGDEDRPVRELPTRDGRPDCDAACSGVGPSEMMAPLVAPRTPEFSGIAPLNNSHPPLYGR